MLRRADADDSRDVLAWRNDPHTRAMSRQTQAIAWDQHHLWFTRVLQDPRRYFVIGMLDQRKVGLVRFDQDEEGSWEVGINLNPLERGQGLGKALLAVAVGYFQDLHPDARLRAEVRLDNAVSRRIFELCGFQWVSRDAICDHFVRDPN